MKKKSSTSFEPQELRKQADQDLKKSTRYLYQLFDEMASGFALHEIICDQNEKPIDYRFLYINPSFEKLTGMAAADIVGKTVLEVFPDTEPFWIETYGRVAQSGQPERFENYAKALGKIFSVVAYCPESGQFAAIFEDITARKQAEEKLVASENRFHTLVETAQDLIWQCDTEGRYTYLNPAWEDVFGYTLDEMLGRKFVDFQSPEYAEKDLQEFKQLLEGDVVTRLETVHLGKDGRQIHLVFNAKQLKDNQGRPAGTQGTAFDISWRKQVEEKIRQSEQELRKAQAYAHVGSWTWEIKTGKLQWSDEMHKIFGISKDDFTGNLENVVANAIHPEDREKVAQSNLKVVEEGMAIPMEYRILHPDGSERVVWTEAGELELDNMGKPALLRGIVMDITERKQAESQINRRNEELSALNHLGRQVSQSIVLQNVVAGAVEELLRTVQTDVVFIFLREQDRLIQVGIGPEGVNELLDPIQEHRVGECICGMAVSEGRPLYSKNIYKDERCTWEYCKKAGLHSFAALPLLAGKDVIGVIGLASLAERDFEQQAGFLETIANQITSGIQNAQLFQASERQRKDIATLLEVSQSMTSSLDLDAVLQTIVDKATSLVDLDSGAIYYFKGENLNLGATTPELPPQFPDSLRLISLDDHPHISSCMSSGLPLILPDADTADLTAQERLVCDQRGLRSLLYVPLLIGARAVGTLIVGTVGRTRSFSEPEIGLFINLSNQAALSVENARLYSETQQVASALERQAEELNALQKTVLDITAAQSLPDLLESIVERACHLLGATGGGLYLNDPARQEVRCVVSYNTSTDYVGVVLKHGEGVAGKVAQDGKQLNISDYPTWSGRSLTFEKEKPFSAVLGVPLRWGGQISGVIDLFYYEPGKSFDKDDQELAALFAGHASIAIENSRLLEASQADQAQVRVLNTRLAEVEENERRRIARELHDQVGQSLSALSINMNIMRTQIPEYLPGFKRRLDDSLMLIDQTTDHIRHLMSELRPAVLDDYGLKAALEWVVDSISTRANLKFLVEGECNRFPPRVEIALFRIAQEALGNISRHARARNVHVVLKQDGLEMSMTITDNGVGFDPASVAATEKSGWGLRLMAERAESIGASLQVESTPGNGTRITTRYHDEYSSGG